MRKILFGILIVTALFCAFRLGIRHAMEDSYVSVYLDGTVEIYLDGDVYEHRAF